LNKRILSFDFGLKRIGVATGTLKTKTSQALSTLRAKAGEPDSRELKKLLDDWKPELLVVGLPLSMDGSESTMSGAARQFGKKISEYSGLPVHFVDERLSSVSADNLLQDLISPGKKKTRKHIGARDNLAAQLILQTYFDDN
jgi:putative Holliday junction resolvase